MRFDISAGDGDDTIGFSMADGLENEGGRFSLQVAGGAGHDRLLLEAVDPCFIPGSETRIALNGNSGDDQIDVSLTNAEIEGRFDLVVGGGDGSDIIHSFIVPCLLPGGSAILQFNGGAGHDRIAARIKMDADSQGSLAAAVVGGLGDDDLTLAIFGAEELDLLAALADGGDGFDIARVTRNVRVVNCEQVVDLEEPR